MTIKHSENNMRYAQIREMDVSNGRGLGISLFVQGCHFHCKGCFNQETWDFDGGKEWNEDVENKFLSLLDRPYIKRISILGGEPLEKGNLKPLQHLLLRAKEKRSDISIWLYTGYTYETLQDGDDFDVKLLLEQVDYLVDGQFELEKQDMNMPFAGSTNQRIINLRRY